MSDISQIQVNGTTYDLCDATARTEITNLQDSVIYKTSFEMSNQNTIKLSPGGWNGGIAFELLGNGWRYQLMVEESGLKFQKYQNSTWTTCWTK